VLFRSLEIAREAEEDLALLQSAPHHAAVERLDEVKAVKEPVLRWREGM